MYLARKATRENVLFLFQYSNILDRNGIVTASAPTQYLMSTDGHIVQEVRRVAVSEDVTSKLSLVEHSFWEKTGTVTYEQERPHDMTD